MHYFNIKINELSLISPLWLSLHTSGKHALLVVGELTAPPAPEVEEDGDPEEEGGGGTWKLASDLDTEPFLIQRTTRRYLSLKWTEAKWRRTVEWRSSMWKAKRCSTYCTIKMDLKKFLLNWYLSRESQTLRIKVSLIY